MPFQIGSIVAKLGIDTEGLQAQINEVKRGVAELKKALENATPSNPFGGLNEALKNVSSNAAKAATSLAAVGKEAAKSAERALIPLSKFNESKFAAVSPFINGLKAAHAEFTRLQKVVSAPRQGLLDHKQAQTTADSIRSAFKNAFSFIASGFQQIGKAAVSAGRSITIAFSGIGSIATNLAGSFAQIAAAGAGRGGFIGNLVGGFAQIGKAAASAGALIANSFGGQIGKAAGNFGGVVSGLVNGFIQIGKAAITAGGFIGGIGKAIISAPLKAINSLLGAIFNLRTALLTIATVKLFERAGEVDNLRQAFQQLSKSIGTISDVFLKRLRVATRGAVSDLELMRLANNAILLGAAKTADQFVELAEAARRLGQATGRSTSQALEDLSLGIGRQSRLLLDNIGIIARAEIAYAKFAVSVGKGVQKLTDSERRLAFSQEVMRAIRVRLAELGPDFETVGQAVQRLGATISNTFTDIAEAIVSRNAVAGLADLLEASRPRIRGFIAFVRTAIDEIVRIITTGFDRLRSGDLTIAQVLDATLGAAFRVILATVKSFVVNLAPVLFEAGVVAGKSFVSGLVSVTKDKARSTFASFIRIFSGFSLPNTLPRDRNIRLAQIQLDEVNKVLNKLKAILSEEEISPIRRGAIDLGNALNKLAEESAKRLKEVKAAVSKGLPLPETDIDERIQKILDELIAFRGRAEDILSRPEDLEATRGFMTAFEKAAKAIAKEAGGASKVVEDEFKKFGTILTGSADTAEAALKRIKAALREGLRDPLAGQRPIQTINVLQPVADGINKLIDLRKNLLDRFGEKIPDIVVRVTAKGAEAAINTLDAVERGLTRLGRLFRGPELDPEEFNRLIGELQKDLDALKFEELVAGATEGSLAVAKLEEKFRGLQLSLAQRSELDTLAVELRSVASAADAAKAVEALRESIENFGLTDIQATVRRIQKGIEELRSSAAFKVKASDIVEGIDKIKISDVINRDIPTIESELDFVKRRLGESFDPATLEAQLKELSTIQIRLESEELGRDARTAAAIIAGEIDVIKARMNLALKGEEGLANLESKLKRLGGLVPQEIANRLKSANEELAAIAQSDAENKIAEIEKEFAGLLDLLEGEALEKARKQLDDLKSIVVGIDISSRLRLANEELEAIGQSDVDQKIAEIERAFAGLNRVLGDDALAKARQQIQDLKEITIGIDISSRLKAANDELAAIGQSDVEQKIAEIDSAFAHLGDVLEGDALERARKQIEALKSTVVGIDIAKKLRAANDELREIGQSDAQKKIAEIDRAFAKLEKTLKGDALAKAKKEIEDLKDLVIRVDVELKIDEFENQIRQFRDQLDNLSQGESVAREIERAALKAQFLGASQLDLDRFERLRQDALKIQAQQDFQDLTKGLSTSIFSGIVEGFERGESAAKIWAGIVSDVFRNSMQKVIDGLSNTISEALGSVFGKLGLGIGAADFATGLLGVGSAILVGLRNRQEQTVQDFSQQVNSSEAIRGVVAGPTNVAISKVGDSLKFALRTVESQLERIAVAVERGSGTGKTATGAPFSTRLTSSTPS